jgi:thioredoxin 1
MKWIYFKAGWCGPCRMQAPTMKKLAERVEVEAVDVDSAEAGGLLQKYSVRAVPTSILVGAEGETLERLTGANPLDRYLELWNKHSV